MVTKFRNTTDELFSSVTKYDFAKAASCSVASIDQARLRKGAKAVRPPPKGWEGIVEKLAKRQIQRLEKLLAKLKVEK